VTKWALVPPAAEVRAASWHAPRWNVLEVPPSGAHAGAASTKFRAERERRPADSRVPVELLKALCSNLRFQCCGIATSQAGSQTGAPTMTVPPSQAGSRMQPERKARIVSTSTTM